MKPEKIEDWIRELDNLGLDETPPDKVSPDAVRAEKAEFARLMAQ